MSDKKSFRINVSLPEGLFVKVEAYADMMGLSLSEACRHLVIKGVEQVQALVNARDSVDALNRMTATFDRGLQREEEMLKTSSERSSAPRAGRPRKSVGELVTPPQNAKNGTTQKVEDIFK